MGRSREHVLVDGVGISLRSKQWFFFRCCDCSLVHRIALVSVKGGWIGMAVKRDKAATAKARAIHGER